MISQSLPRCLDCLGLTPSQHMPKAHKHPPEITAYEWSCSEPLSAFHTWLKTDHTTQKIHVFGSEAKSHQPVKIRLQSYLQDHFHLIHLRSGYPFNRRLLLPLILRPLFPIMFTQTMPPPSGNCSEFWSRGQWYKLKFISIYEYNL